MRDSQANHGRLEYTFVIRQHKIVERLSCFKLLGVGGTFFEVNYYRFYIGQYYKLFRNILLYLVVI